MFQINLSNLRERTVYRPEDDFEPGGLCVSEDGQYAVLTGRKAGVFRLILLNVPKGTGTTILESSERIENAAPRPKRAGILYTLGGRELHVVNFDGAQNQKLRIGAGGLGPSMWSQDGRVVEYLNFPEDPKQLHDMREYTPDSE